MSDRNSEVEAAMAWEREHYPFATEDVRRMLFHARPTIRRFINSDLGRERPRDVPDPKTTEEGARPRTT